jgi:hypothetical protein
VQAFTSQSGHPAHRGTLVQQHDRQRGGEVISDARA